MEQALEEALQLWGGRVEHVAAIERRRDEPDIRQDAVAAHAEPPRLIDEHTVRFDPAWHRLLAEATGFGLHATPWTSDEPGAHVTRAAGFYVWSQLESGHGCPISMTYAAVPALRHEPELAEVWTPRLADPASVQLAGMTMTERQGGSDLKAITTRAEPRADGTYRLIGEKWFCSAPMSDVFLVLANDPGGLTCFLVPRQDDFRLLRLKHKLGNRSNASAEIAFTGASAERVGAEGRGLSTILQAVAATRLDCVLGSAALMRRGLDEAIAHTATRTAFGGPLLDKPVMRGVLADLALEAEAALALGMRLAAAVDRDEHDLLRLALPAAKYLVCKRTTDFMAEALECFGGNGYVEDASPMALLLREAPLNSIWEGSGSIQALDVVRALSRSPASLDAWLTEVGAASRQHPELDRAIDDILASLADLTDLEHRARRLAERFARVLQAALLVRYTPEVGAAFCTARLSPVAGRTFGTLPGDVDHATLLARAIADG